MVSTGEIYYRAFKVRRELLDKGIQTPVVDIRKRLKELTDQNKSLDEAENEVVIAELKKEAEGKKG